MQHAERYTLDEVKNSLEQIVANAESGQTIEIVRSGRVVARIVPGRSRVGRGKGTAQIHGDLLENLGESWEVEQG